MSSDANFAVVRELYPEKRGLFRNKVCPAVNEMQECIYGMDKAYVVSQLSAPGARDDAAKRGDRLFAVSKRRIGFSTVALKVCKEDGYEWNYAIEGAKTMLSERYGFVYRPGHLENGDFANGLDGWRTAGSRLPATKSRCSSMSRKPCSFMW